jgi:hypothetical protein
LTSFIDAVAGEEWSSLTILPVPRANTNDQSLMARNLQPKIKNLPESLKVEKGGTSTEKGWR